MGRYLLHGDSDKTGNREAKRPYVGDSIRFLTSGWDLVIISSCSLVFSSGDEVACFFRTFVPDSTGKSMERFNDALGGGPGIGQLGSCAVPGKIVRRLSMVLQIGK